MSRWHCLVLSPLLFAAAYGFEVLDAAWSWFSDLRLRVQALLRDDRVFT